MTMLKSAEEERRQDPSPDDVARRIVEEALGQDWPRSEAKAEAPSMREHRQDRRPSRKTQTRILVTRALLIASSVVALYVPEDQWPNMMCGLLEDLEEESPTEETYTSLLETLHTRIQNRLQHGAWYS